MASQTNGKSWQKGYKVPVNFIPGMNHSDEYEAKCNKHNNKNNSHNNNNNNNNNNKHEITTRRGSYQQLITPITKYMKRIKINGSPPMKNRSMQADNQKDVSRNANIPDINIESDMKLLENETPTITRTGGMHSEEQIDMLVKESICSVENSEEEFRKLRSKSAQSLTGSLPELSRPTSVPLLEEEDVNLLHGMTKLSTDITPSNQELFGIVQDELRRKLPKTLYMTASIGMQNPLCVTGSIRASTVHHRESVVTPPPARSFKKNHSIGTLDLTGFNNKAAAGPRRGSLFSKLLSTAATSKHSSVSIDPPISDRKISSSSPALFNRARVYAAAGRRRLFSTGSGYES